jgi:predicted polyphosphate/ATP-dependent NAD kinase
LASKILGLIVNPVAGIGGRVGLKGSDGLDIQQLARDLGAQREASNRAAIALRQLHQLEDNFAIITYPGEMGEKSARECGFTPLVIGSIPRGDTTAEDTRLAASAMRQRGVDLLLFAGGDGTARDIYNVIGDSLPVLGIPAGVKIHSGVYAINPVSAGELARQYITGEITTLREGEVMDLDEAAYRTGRVSPRLYGYLKIPFHRRLLQDRKSPNPSSTASVLDGIAQDVIDGMQEDTLYLVGPGTTTLPILARLGLNKTLIGIDVVRNRQLMASDVTEANILKLLAGHRGVIVVTPIGGQGHIFGRGNQPFSPRVISQVRRENIIVVSTPEKIRALNGQPLLVDSGDLDIDQMLSGYMRVITGYGEQIVYRVRAGLA